MTLFSSPVFSSVSTHEKYDKMGNLVYQKDGNNNVIAITYDKLGRPLVQTNPDGTTNRFSYDSVSNEIILTNQNNVKQKIKYDKLGREHAIYMEEPGSGYQKMKQTDYDLFSRPIKISLYAQSETTPSSVMEYTYYADSSPKSETAKEGSKVLSKKDYAYAISNSLNQTTVEVYSTDTAKTQIVQKTDVHGVIKEQQAIFDGKTYTQSFTHDTLGNVLTTTDFRANDENYTNKAVQKNTYDHANRVTKQEVLKDDGTYMESTVTYDKLGRAVSATDFNGNTVTTAYNKLNKETEVVTPMEENVTAKVKYFYDAAGNVTKQYQQNNKPGEAERFKLVETVYNSMNQLVSVISNDGNIDNIVKYEYDGIGNITKMTTGITNINDAIDPSVHGVTTYTYNYLNQLVSTTDPQGNSVTNIYDKLGNVT
ncbi:RHS repeat domain-containing protein, partial [Acetivibrio sp. MSJd-27]|uniref:RHS repeat domain-containing protein n=1 Tax=Acetivibrio sp. MSJd-27 TaxID=2841523 RepID=UPI001C0FAFE6